MDDAVAQAWQLEGRAEGVALKSLVCAVEPLMSLDSADRDFLNGGLAQRDGGRDHYDSITREILLKIQEQMRMTCSVLPDEPHARLAARIAVACEAGLWALRRHGAKYGVHSGPAYAPVYWLAMSDILATILPSAA